MICVHCNVDDGVQPDVRGLPLRIIDRLCAEWCCDACYERQKPGRIAALASPLPTALGETNADSARLDWLQERGVCHISMDDYEDGTIDVAGNSVRDAIDKRRAALAQPHAEQPDADDKAALKLCSDCPPAGYPTDLTRCKTCPLRAEPYRVIGFDGEA